MKIAFHLENLSFRGTTVAVRDYAYYNRSILNNESVFFYKDDLIKTPVNNEDCTKREYIFNQIKENYDFIEYKDIADLEVKLKSHKCDYAYFLKAGFNDGIFTESTKSLIHCVFNYYQPHGHKYVYVSEWLAQQNNNLYVPHIVELPRIPTNLQHRTNKFVVGRIGGYDQFDIPFVHNIINFVVNNDEDFTFVFVNTRPFINHPRVQFLDAIVDPQEKTNFIQSCDAMIHARSDGESFGLSIMEFLFHNKPVISFGGGRDKHNVAQLDNYDLIYNNEYELLQCLFKLKNRQYNKRYATIAEQFSPTNVMERFNRIFLET